MLNCNILPNPLSYKLTHGKKFFQKFIDSSVIFAVATILGMIDYIPSDQFIFYWHFVERKREKRLFFFFTDYTP